MKRHAQIMLLVVLLAGLAALLWTPVKGMMERFHGDRTMLPLLSRATVSIVYELDSQRETVFAIPQGTDVLRVLVNGAIDRSGHLAADEDVSYAVEYRVLDSKGQVLSRTNYHQRSIITEYSDGATGKNIPGYFFLSGDVKPLDGRILMINLKGLGVPAQLRFRLRQGDNKLKKAYIRVYVKARKPERVFRHLWKKLTDYQKERYALGNVYPYDFLIESEKKNILFNLWEPLGPAGVDAQGYSTKELYIVKETEGPVLDEIVLPAGLFVEKGQRGIVPVPRPGGVVRLAFASIEKNLPPAKGIVNLRWYGVTAFQRVAKTIAWNGREGEFTGSFAGGMIEITPPADMVIRAFLREGSKETEITPGILYVNAYLLEQGKPVEFAISHNEKLATPFRVDLRVLYENKLPGPTSGPLKVTYELLNAAGLAIKTGTFNLAPEVSLYDRVSMLHRQDMAVSDPASWYFSFSEKIKKIRFSSSAPVLVNGYNRPLSLMRETRVPADYYIPVERDDRQPVWFVLKPLDHEKMLMESRAILLAIQFRPPEDIPGILAGKYDWEDYHPEGQWRARRILTLQDEAAVFRAETAGALYRLVQANTLHNIKFVAYPGMRTAQPRLLFVRDTDEPAILDVMVDGRKLYAGWLAAGRGEIVLPPLDLQPHDLKIAFPGKARFYLSNLAPGGQAYLLRLGNLLDKKGISFFYDKKTDEEEIISARLHVPAAFALRPVLLEVGITGPQVPPDAPRMSWTPFQRRYVVEPYGGSPLPVFQAGDLNLDGGQTMFIPLGNDLAAGRYQITFNLQGAREGYLILYRLIPGIHSQSRFFMENLVRSRGGDE